MDRTKALRRVQELNFAMIELGLYLNTHPCDENALMLYERVQLMHGAAKAKYEECYGPLSYEGVIPEKDGWSWVHGPWPWEGEC
ncbi:MAG: spore coat protein CotJB [Bacillota bacterium]|nr:spore coat protein CotJB [Bacillota bacterium]